MVTLLPSRTYLRFFSASFSDWLKDLTLGLCSLIGSTQEIALYVYWIRIATSRWIPSRDQAISVACK